MEEIKINFSKEEKKFVEKYAEQHKETLAEYIKKAVFEQIEDEEDKKAYQRAKKEYEKDKTTYSHNEMKILLGL